MVAALLIKLIASTPELPEVDARATECVYDDYACLAEHDVRVLDMARLTGDIKICDVYAVIPAECRSEFTWMIGEL